MPADNYATLMVLPGHYEAIKSYCDSQPVPITTSRLITARMTPKIGPALGIAIPNARNPHEAVRFATWLRPKCSQPYFEDITLPVWSMKKLVKAVKDSEKEIDELFPREGIGLKNPNYRYHISFAYRAGIWLLLALNYIESDYLHKWTRNHRRYDGFVRWTRAQHPNRTHQTHPPIPLTNVSVHNDGGD